MNPLVKSECIIQYEEIDKTNLTSLTVEQLCANAGAMGSVCPLPAIKECTTCREFKNSNKKQDPSVFMCQQF